MPGLEGEEEEQAEEEEEEEAEEEEEDLSFVQEGLQGSRVFSFKRFGQSGVCRRFG